LIQIWKHLPSLRRGESLKPWLVRIVVNEVNRERRKKQVPTVPLEFAPEIVDDCDDAATAMIAAKTIRTCGGRWNSFRWKSKKR